MNNTAFTSRASEYKSSMWLLYIAAALLYSLTACSPKLSKPPQSASASTSSGKLMVGSPAVKLEIHHININNGDASVIRIVHADGSETKVLIDGGQMSADQRLLPYCNAMFKDASFKYVILTHYHNDHYNGLLALGDGTIRGEYYIDLGGYNMDGFVSSGNLSKIQPADNTCPWTDTTGIFGGTMDDYITAIGKAADNFGLKRYTPMTTTSDKISDLIGVVVPIDTFMIGTKTYPINMRCVALWGFTMSSAGTAVDNWKNGASKNDPCIAFVLECGEFRYFFGGDMGGDPTGSYIDQETTLAGGFQYLYKGAKSYYNPGASYDGHVCGFKANHHGSAHSNNSTFLNGMRPGVCVTSAGSNEAWHLPSIDFLKRLAATIPLTPASDIPTFAPPFTKAQGFFFTNLFNFTAGNSLTVANGLFAARNKTGYQYGNAPGQFKRSYQVIVALNNSVINFSKQSTYGVVSVDSAFKVSPFLTVIGCHQR
jgi:beta-lactamase superfamily II metal-dependent hydrolase